MPRQGHSVFGLAHISFAFDAINEYIVLVFPNLEIRIVEDVYRNVTRWSTDSAIISFRGRKIDSVNSLRVV